MTTIKSYTDIPQSKKLAEILSFESADMSWVSCDDGRQKYYQAENRKIILNYEKNHWLPCWSLAALLELLPKRLEIVDNVYELSVCFYGLYYWNINNGNLCFESKDKDNFIDACYELIIKLKELNLL